MTDYIKREDALEQFDYYDLGEYLTTQIRGMLMDIPSADVAPVRHGRWEVVDAEPVVRCKDCKHRDPEDKKCDFGHTIIWQLPRDDDWFCADGERRDDE